MKKRFCTLLLSLSLALSLTACGSEDLANVSGDEAVEETVEGKAEEETEEVAEEDDEKEDEAEEVVEEKKDNDSALGMDLINAALDKITLPDNINKDALAFIIAATADYLSDVDLTSLDQIVAQYIDDNHCWVACLEKEAYLFYFDGINVEITHLENEDGEIKVTTEKGDFVIDAEKLKINTDEATDYAWEIITEGDSVALVIVGPNEEKMELFAPDVETEEEAVELITDYIENETTAEEVIEEKGLLSKLLEGYEGVSIVDALISVGINPTLENRKELAEALKIIQYIGTSDQNLEMIEDLGGKILGKILK